MIACTSSLCHGIQKDSRTRQTCQDALRCSRCWARIEPSRQKALTRCYSSLCSLQHSASRSTCWQLFVSFLSDKSVYWALLPPYTFTNCFFLPAIAIWDDSLRARRDSWCSLEVAEQFSGQKERKKREKGTHSKTVDPWALCPLEVSHRTRSLLWCPFITIT